MPVSVITKVGAARSVRGAGFLWRNLNHKAQTMIKTLEVITEAIRNPNHPFRKVDNQPKKPQKHRYERRKIKEYLHLADWQGEQAT